MIDRPHIGFNNITACAVLVRDYNTNIIDQQIFLVSPAIPFVSPVADEEGPFVVERVIVDVNEHGVCRMQFRAEICVAAVKTEKTYHDGEPPLYMLVSFFVVGVKPGNPCAYSVTP